MLSRFHLVPERNGQTDGQTDRQTQKQLMLKAESKHLFQISKIVISDIRNIYFGYPK